MRARKGQWQMTFGSVLVVRAVVASVQDVHDHRDPFGLGINVTAGLIALAAVFGGNQSRKRAKRAD